MNVLTAPLIAVSIRVRAFGDVVEIVAKRVLHRFGDHDLGGEMRDRVDRVLLDQTSHQAGVAAVAYDELRAFGHGPCEARRQIVEHDDCLASVQEPERHVAADIAGAAGHQYAHALPLWICPDAAPAGKAAWNGRAGS